MIASKLPINHEITQLLQEVFNLLPNLDVDAIVKAFTLQTNDMMLVVYVSSVVRSVLALHALINNKVIPKPKSQTLNPKPTTQNPEPKTPNPKPQIRLL